VLFVVVWGVILQLLIRQNNFEKFLFCQKRSLWHNRRMKKKSLIIWKVFFLLYAALTARDIINALSSSSNTYTFYHMMIIFDPLYKLHYTFKLINISINTLCLIPLFLFCFSLSRQDSTKNFFPKSLWTGLFLLRIVSDTTGHFYELKHLEALLQTGLLQAIVSMFRTFAFVFLSYWAHFMYAFRRKTAETI